MYTGLCLTFCVRDIIQGKLKIKDVKEIFNGTACKDEAEWAEAISAYKQHFWTMDPERAGKIAWRLIRSGKVHQPKLKGGVPPKISCDGWWKTDEGKIIFFR